MVNDIFYLKTVTSKDFSNSLNVPEGETRNVEKPQSWRKHLFKKLNHCMRNEERQLNVMNILLLFEYNMKTRFITCEASWNLIQVVIISRPYSPKPNNPTQNKINIMLAKTDLILIRLWLTCGNVANILQSGMLFR